MRKCLYCNEDVDHLKKHMKKIHPKEYQERFKPETEEFEDINKKNLDSASEKHYKQGDSLFDQGRFTEAINYYKKALMIHPTDYRTMENLGMCYTALNDLDEAENLFQKVLKMNPSHGAVYHRIGVVKASQNNAKAAIENFLKCLSQTEKTLDDRGDEAVRISSRNLSFEQIPINIGQINPSEFAESLNFKFSEDTIEILGSILSYRKMYDYAEICFKKLLELYPNSSNGHINLANIYVDKIRNIPSYSPDLKKIMSLYKKAIELYPSNHEAWNNLGSHYVFLNDLDKAKECYEKSIDLKNDYSSAYGSLGCVLGKLGQIQEARESLEKALEINPLNGLAFNALRALEMGTFDEFFDRLWDRAAVF